MNRTDRLNHIRETLRCGKVAKANAYDADVAWLLEEVRRLERVEAMEPELVRLRQMERSLAGAVQDFTGKVGIFLGPRG
jgi:hypothetical protein